MRRLITLFRQWLGDDHGLMRFGLAVALGVLLLDLASKALASAWLVEKPIVLIPGFFDLTLVHNPGAAFGLLADQPAWIRHTMLLGFASLAMLFILQQLRESSERFTSVAFALVLGGAVGNVVDRLRLGWVVDFIHVHWHDLSWPVFNIADSAITIGVGLLLLHPFRQPPSKTTRDS